MHAMTSRWFVFEVTLFDKTFFFLRAAYFFSALTPASETNFIEIG
jgi:hypothetical protein